MSDDFIDYRSLQVDSHSYTLQIKNTQELLTGRIRASGGNITTWYKSPISGKANS